MVKYYYYVNLNDTDIVTEGNVIKIPLNGKSFKKVKVLNASFECVDEISNPVLRMDTYSGNGFTSDRKGVALCLFDQLTYVSATDWRYSSSQTPEYHISDSLSELQVYLAGGAGGFVVPDETITLQFILELDDLA